MPVPSSIADLSQTAGSNYPSGSESPSTIDDYLRVHASYLAQLRDGKGASAEVELASASTVDIGAANSPFIKITGTTAITSFGTNYNGPRYLRFTGSLTLTHNATTLILPGGANVAISAGDTCIVVPNGSPATGWQVVASSGASLVGFAQSGVGAIARTVLDKERETQTPKDYAAVANGIADDSAALLKVAAAVSAAGGGEIDLCGLTYYVPAGVYDFSAFSNITFKNGTIKGPDVSVQGQPTAGLKFWGSTGTSVSFGSTIAKNTASFAVANTFTKDTLLLLSNFPTDATDAYTSGSSDIFGRVQRVYSNVSSSNKRQTRRKEILQVAATGNPFKTYWATENAYSDTTQLKFEVITPVSGITFRGVTFKNVWIDAWLCDGFRIDDCVGLSSMVLVGCCINSSINFKKFDAQGADVRVDVYEASKACPVTGIYRNHNSPADNGIVKFNGSMQPKFDITVEGGYSTYSHGLMIDANYDGNPSGYTDLPFLGIDGNVQAGPMGGLGVVITNNPYATTSGYGTLTFTSDSCGLQVKGVTNIHTRHAINYKDGSNNSVFCYGTTSCSFIGQRLGGVFTTGTVVDSRGAGTTSNTGLEFDETGTWTPTVQFAGAGVGQAYTVQYGYYQRRGREITAKFAAVMSLKGSSTGTARISGLPYAGESGAYKDSSGLIGQSSGMSGLIGPILATVDQGATTIALFQQGATGTAQLTDANFTNSSWLIGEVVYNVA